MANPHTSVKARKHGVPNKMSSARVERHELVIGGTASVEIAVLLDQLERVNRPVLASRLNHVEMCEQEDRLAASVIGSGILETAIRL
jgi:hypothetical protein